MSQPQPEYKAGDTIELPLSKLILSKDNPRRTKEKGHDPVLTASIRSRGLLQNLGVRVSPANEGKFEVRFGERRLKSLRHLTKCKHFGKDELFACKIVSSDDAEAEEAALAENIARKNMNPVDEFEAFSRLEDMGLSVADIAERFGVTEKQVQQRLALGNAAPCVRKALRDGEISLDIAKIFAGAPDIARQERVFKAIDERGSFSAYTVKQMLHEGAVTASDDLVRFVTLEAYEEAGGAVERDLFCDEVRLGDVELVYRLRDEKLQREVDRLTGDGWSWVEAHEGCSYEIMNGFTRIYGAAVEKTEAETCEIETLEKELEALEADGASRDEWSDAQWDAYEEAEERLSALKEIRRVFTAGQKAVAGCIVCPARDGVQVHEGLVRKADVKKAKAAQVGEGGEDAAGDNSDDDAIGPGYGIGLAADLAAFKAQALQAALACDPATATLALQFVIVFRVLAEPCRHFPKGSTLSAPIAGLRAGNGALGETQAAKTLATIEKSLRTDIFAGAGYAGAWRAFCNLGSGERDALVAFAFSRTIEPMGASAGFMDVVAHEMQADIRRFWKPSAQNFFARIKKDQLTAFLKETVGPDEAACLTGDFKLKKSELAELCEDLIEGRAPAGAQGRKALDGWAPAGMAFDEPPAPAAEKHGFDDSEFEGENGFGGAENEADDDAGGVAAPAADDEVDEAATA
jgi:ParB family chromosome partitioning protein